MVSYEAPALAFSSASGDTNCTFLYQVAVNHILTFLSLQSCTYSMGRLLNLLTYGTKNKYSIIAAVVGNDFRWS
jgi:hypothetical protein